MFKVFTLLVFVLAVGGGKSEENKNLTSEEVSKNGARQKRLLYFKTCGLEIKEVYDEEGNIVKTFTNPLRDFSQNGEKIPFFGSFWNPFYALLRPTSTFSNTPTPYMIPVSDAVIQQIHDDPVYQNKLVFRPQEPVIQLNPLCLGKRAPIPSPRLCNNFLNCWDGWAFEQECPTGLLFSFEGYCDYPDKVDCNNRWLRVDPQPKCHKDFETFRSESICSEFYICVNRLPIKFKCPADLAFNQELGICDYPQRVNCDASSTISTMPLSDTPNPVTEVTMPTPGTITGQIPLESTPSDVKSNIVSNTLYKSWSTNHIAISRQDAIRQLQLESIAKVNTA